LRFSVIVDRVARRSRWGISASLATFLLLVLPAVNPARAAVRDYYFERVGGTHGLAQNTVTALAQDADGFVWVGTQGGLHRFDGQRYTVFRQDPRDPGSLPDSFVTAVAAGPGRTLWIGTYSQYVARLDLATGRIRRYPGGAEGDGAEPRQVVAVLP